MKGERSKVESLVSAQLDCNFDTAVESHPSSIDPYLSPRYRHERAPFQHFIFRNSRKI